MTREEERKQAANEYVNHYYEGIGIDPKDNKADVLISITDFIKGAEWADEHPRTDVIHIDSISSIRMTLVKNFCKIAKMHPNMSINDNPDMKAAYEMIDQFDRACESAGFMLNEDTGFYDIKSY